MTDQNDEPLSQSITAPSLAKINPEAGSHPIPDDPLELAAAITAGQQVLAYFPYLIERYGERGSRFTSSDSAWLVTLASLDSYVIEGQILWLGGVLGSRGIPRIILEIHLRHLYQELCRVRPEKEKTYKNLLIAADILKAKRERWLTPALFSGLVDKFHASAAGELPGALQHAGEFIVAAVTDEKDGVVDAVESMESWLVDPHRFAPAWIGAVNSTIAQARQFSNK